MMRSQLHTIDLNGVRFVKTLPYRRIVRSISRIASQINDDYGRLQDTVPVFVGVLDGAFMFCAELLRQISFPCEIAFVKLASYQGTTSEGDVRQIIGLRQNVANRHVIVLEDIVDTGKTISHLTDALLQLNPASVQIAAMFFKPDSYRGSFPVRYYAMRIPEDFIVGHGLDYDQLGRNLPDIYKIVRHDTSPAADRTDCMMLPVVEDFYSLQGEGRNAGMPAYFIRLAGCDVGCPWCDSKPARSFDAGIPTAVDVLAARVGACGAANVVITGGEPLAHDLGPLTNALHDAGFDVFVETSGTKPFSGSFDWVTLSPKRHLPPLDEAFGIADELKVVVESSDDLQWAAECAAKTSSDCLLFLQPEWSRRQEITPLAVDFIKRNPQWKLSLQTHKFIDIP